MAGAPKLVTPDPIRPAQLTAVRTRAFTLPNGARVELNADLDAMLRFAVGSTPNLAPATGGPVGACDRHLRIEAAVTSLELDVTQFGVTFGYSPTGEIWSPSTITGSVDVRLGTVAMTFGLWECDSPAATAGGCVLRASTNVNQTLAGITGSFKVDLGTIRLGADLIHRTALGPALQKMMVTGMAALSVSPKLGGVGWSARVREVGRAGTSEAGTFLFDAGDRDRVAVNQTFAVYAAIPASGACDVYRAVAYAHTTRVDMVSSVAAVDQVLDPAGLAAVREGQLVLVRKAPAK